MERSAKPPEKYGIMLADDHTMIRQGLKRIIEEISLYEVVAETGDGLQILPSMRKHPPDMIILDISMPHLRGTEVIGKIRRINKKIKILILTMHKNEDYVYQCLSAGAHGYVLKEDADSELLSAIDSLKNGKFYISQSFSSDVIRERNQRIPIIICSAYRLMEDDVIVKTSDVAAFFTKPADMDALKMKVFELIGE